MLSVTLFLRCCSTRERWKDVVEQTLRQFHLQSPSSRFPSLPSLQLRARLQSFCPREHLLPFKILPEVQLSDLPGENKFTINILPQLKCLHCISSTASQEEGSKRARAVPGGLSVILLLVYPISPRSRTGCTFCAALSTKQTKDQNISTLSLPQSSQGWFKLHFPHFCLFASSCKWPRPHGLKTKLSPQKTTHAWLSYISNNAGTVCHYVSQPELRNGKQGKPLTWSSQVL